MSKYADRINKFKEEVKHTPKPKLVVRDSVVEENKKTQQVVIFDHNQWYKIIHAKAACMDYKLTEEVFRQGLIEGETQPFILRTIKTIPADDKLLMKEYPVVTTPYPYKVFVPWLHNKSLPSFITYSSLPFKHNGRLARLIDIDRDELTNYSSDLSGFDSIYKNILKSNLGGNGGWLISEGDVNHLRAVLCEMAETVRARLHGVSRVWFSGAGLRCLAEADNKDELSKMIDGWCDQNLVCTSSTAGYQAQKLFSVQLNKPHFQTDVDPTSKLFKWSNPCFFYANYSKEDKALLKEYYHSHLSSRYFGEASKEERFTSMQARQKIIGGEVIERLCV